MAVAHPHWYVLTQEDIAALGPVHAVEVFNGTAVDHNDRQDSWHIADILLGRGQRYFVCATDDFHGTPQRHDFCRGWVWVKSEELSPEALLAALQAGSYYSSTGPQLHDIQVEPGERVVVRCSPRPRLCHRQGQCHGDGLWQWPGGGGTEPARLRQPLLQGDRPRPVRRPCLVQPDLV